MASLGELSVNLTAKTAEFQKGLKGATKSIEAFGAKAAGISKKAGFAFAGLAAGIALVARAADKQRQAELKLAGAIRGTGAAIDIDKIKGMASALQAVSTVGDEVTLGQAALMVGFGATEKQVMTLMPRIADLAAMLGKDMQAVTMAFGQAIQGNASMLRRYGVSMSEAELAAFKLADGQERVNMLLDKSAYAHGAAENAAKTAVGAFSQMTNALGDVFEGMGFIIDADLGGVFNSMTTAIKSVGEILDETSPEFDNMASSAIMLSAGILALTTGTAGVVALGATLAKFSPILYTFGLAFGALALKVLLVVAAVAALVTLLGQLTELMGIDWAGIVKGYNANPMYTDSGGEPAKTPGKSGFMESFASDMSRTLSESFGVGMGAIATVAKETRDAIFGLGEAADDAKKDLDDLVDRKTKAASKKTDKGAAAQQENLFKSITYTPSGTVAEGASAQAAVTWRNFADAELSQALNRPFEISVDASSLALPPSAWDRLPGALTGGRTPGQTAQAGGFGMLDAAAGGMEEHGGIIQGASAGAQVGGIFGAIIGAIVGLLTSTERFETHLRLLDDSFGAISDLFDPIVEAMDVTAVAMGDVVKTFGELLGPLFVQLAAALKFSQYGVRLLTGIFYVFAAVTSALQNAMIWILDKFLSVIEEIASWFGIDEDVIKLREQLENAKTDTQEYLDMAVDYWTKGDDYFKDQVDAFTKPAEEMGDAAKTVSEKLLNVPTGFKAALRRFESTNISAFQPGRELDRDVTADRTTIYVDRMDVSVGDPEEFVQSISDIVETMNSQQNGSSGSGMDVIDTIPLG